MKNTIGVIALLLISQSIFAESSQTNPAETKLIESDASAETMPAATTEATATEAVVIETEAAPVAMKEQSGFSRGSVVRSAFTRDIDAREPTENLQNLTNDNNQVKFFTELRDMSGQTATHRWEYDGKVVAEVKFDVKGPRWRVWSSKSFVPKWTGDWKVSVLNGAGEVISEKNLSYDVATIETPAAETISNTEEPAAATTATESM